MEDKTRSFLTSPSNPQARSEQNLQSTSIQSTHLSPSSKPVAHLPQKLDVKPSQSQSHSDTVRTVEIATMIQPAPSKPPKGPRKKTTPTQQQKRPQDSFLEWQQAQIQKQLAQPSPVTVPDRPSPVAVPRQPCKESVDEDGSSSSSSSGSSDEDDLTDAEKRRRQRQRAIEEQRRFARKQRKLVQEEMDRLEREKIDHESTQAAQKRYKWKKSAASTSSTPPSPLPPPSQPKPPPLSKPNLPDTRIVDLLQKYSRFLKDSPVGGEGEWMLREFFKGRKSFGFFLCHACGRPWLSAHSDVRYRQSCKKCNFRPADGNYPLLLWVNRYVEKRDADATSEGHHEASLCEACLKGDCNGASKMDLLEI